MTRAPVHAADLPPYTFGQPCQGCRRRARDGPLPRDDGHLPIITSVDLMIATTESPGLRPRRSTDAFVIRDTTSWPPTSTTTSLITAPGVTVLILPLS